MKPAPFELVSNYSPVIGMESAWWPPREAREQGIQRVAEGSEVHVSANVAGHRGLEGIDRLFNLVRLAHGQLDLEADV